MPDDKSERTLLAALGIGQIISWGTLYYSFPLIAEGMGRELGMAKPEVYGAASVGLLVSSLGSYPIGAAIDRGHGRAILSIGSLLAVALLILWSAISNAWMLYPLMILIGIAQSMILYEPAFAVVARAFASDPSRKILTLTLWGGFASTVFVPIIQLFLSHTTWRTTLFLLALTNLFVLFLHFRFIPKKPATIVDVDSRNKNRRTDRAALKWALKHKIFWALLIAFTVYYGTFSGIAYHLYPLLLERNMTPAIAVAAMAVLGPAQVLGRILVWGMARKKKLPEIGRIVVLGFPLATLMLILVPHFAGALLFIAIFGVSNGIMTVIRGTAVPEMLTQEAYGSINGAISIPATMAKAAAPFLIAFLWKFGASYDSVLNGVFAASLLIVAAFWYAAAQGTMRDSRVAVVPGGLDPEVAT